MSKHQYKGAPDPLPAWYAPWESWEEGGKRSVRPKTAPRLIPRWAWVLYAERHPPKPKPSWTLTNGPWIFVTSDPGACRPGPWTRLDIRENLVAPGAPLWFCNQGKVPQAEGGNQASACLEWIKANPGGSIAPVTTLGIDPEPYKALGVTSCFVECYLQEQENALDKMWAASHEGWLDPICCVGVYHDYPLENYAGWLKQYGNRFGVYTSDAMSDADWACLSDLVT